MLVSTSCRNELESASLILRRLVFASFGLRRRWDGRALRTPKLSGLTLTSIHLSLPTGLSPIQENLRGQRIAILELSTNKLRSIEAAVAQLRDAVEKITRAEFRRLPAVTQILHSKVEPRYAALTQTAIEKVIRAWRVRRGLVADVAIRDSRIAVP